MDGSNKSYWITTAYPPGWLDELHERIRIEQERQFMKMLVDVPKYEVSTIDYNDVVNSFRYLSQPVLNPKAVIKLNTKETNKMEAKKCDRCGKLYELPTADENGNGAEVRFKYKYIRRADNMSEKAIADEQTRNIFVKCYCGDEVDFCPECRESLKKWWESDDDVMYTTHT